MFLQDTVVSNPNQALELMKFTLIILFYKTTVRIKSIF